jgi:4a-hydroxytetrahydrobiopterin dehydratase
MSGQLTEETIQALLQRFPEWERRADGALWRGVRCKDFAHAMLLAAAVGHRSEVADHHPDIRIHGYKNVELRLISHDIGALSDRDARLVEEIEALVAGQG